jgi:hypothetical protein
MPRKNRAVLLLLASSVAIMMTGCGGGPNTTGPAPGGFTNANLNGTYAFAIGGTNAGGVFAVAGSFQANGNGTITGGTEDINSPGTTVGVAQNVPITGSYFVRSDGRTTATITSTSPAVTLNLDLVLLNTSTGLVVRFQNNASASGSIDLQNSSAFNLTALAGTFALNVAGVDSNGAPEAAVGQVTLDSSGDITGGTLDDNDNGVATTNPVGVAGLAVSNPVSGRGTATITAGAATFQFVYYVVDANHLKLIEIDPGLPLGGDAFRQTSTTVSGSFAFTLAGTTLPNNVFVAGGILDTDGSGIILNSSVEDADNGVNIAPAGGSAVSGTYSVSGGRGIMQINGGLQTLNLVFYPSTGGLLMLDVDSNLVASGAALQQSAPSFSNASINGAYGLNLTGVDLAAGTEVDGIAQFNTTGTGTLSGALDFNNGGTLVNSLALNGSYSVSANGRGTATLHSNLGNFNIFFYMASGSRVLFIESDNAQVAVGAFALQH